MNEKEVLQDLIENNKKPTVIEWVYRVETFLKETKEDFREIYSYIDRIKNFGDSFQQCENVVAWLRQLYKRKYDCVTLPTITKRNQVFVAMMFSQDMNDVYEKVYKSVIQSLNYTSMRIDEKDYAGLIIDEITSEISNSVALVADLTGNRGGVYYEAGIARGLQLCNHPIKLIFTCRQDFFDSEKVHFDVRGDNILLYADTSDLSVKFRKRLTTVLGSNR